jgi:purine nucleoside phosphorylase
MNKIAIIGGSRFVSLKNLSLTHSTTVNTPFGEPSAPLSYGILGDMEVVYLPRRGSDKPMAPHKINYRANIWALRDAGVQTIIATAAVIGIVDPIQVGGIFIPDQLIDYTYGRENTFLGEDDSVTPINFANPYSDKLRQQFIKTAKALGLPYQQGTYGITQGPRRETIAELERFKRDGCHVVGMTGMPEAALARELDLDYACIALVVQPQSSLQEEPQDEYNVEKLVEAIIPDLF